MDPELAEIAQWIAISSVVIVMGALWSISQHRRERHENDNEPRYLHITEHKTVNLNITHSFEGVFHDRVESSTVEAPEESDGENRSSQGA